MELRHIRYFLTVADEGNFTRAAERLGIGQPPLSMQIKDLEAEIGEQLFYRVPHGAELTAAGRAFLESVKMLPAQASDAIHAAKRAAKGETGQLRLGFTGSATLNPKVPSAIRAFRRRFPEVELTLMENNSAMLSAALVEGRLDVAILRPADANPEGITIRPWVKETLLAVLPTAHPALKERGPLNLASLKEDTFILTPRILGSNLHDAAFAACRHAGFEPRLGQFAPQVVSILLLVSAELGVSLVPDPMRQLNVPGLAFRTLDIAAPPLSLALAYRKHRPPALASNFVKLATTQGIENPTN
jgi:DNA-binding transcriptional LysR family regulator